MNGAEGDVEQAGKAGAEAHALDDQGPESVGDGGASVEAEGHADKEPRFGFEHGFNDVRPLEFARARAGLIGADALNGLQLFVVREEAGGRDVAVEVPVDDRGGDYSYDADEDEETVKERLVVRYRMGSCAKRASHSPFVNCSIWD